VNPGVYRSAPIPRPRRLVAASAASAGFVLLMSAAYLGAYASILAMSASRLASGASRSLGFILLGVAVYTIMLGLPVGGALAIYHALRGPNPTTRGETYCGGCGYRLKGLTEPRCPECGRSL
jgi:hypothetical protein